MAQCKECEFYKPIDAKKGDCFGHEVPASLDVSKCPAHSFKPRTAGNTSGPATTKGKKPKA
nr:hypothetical protein [Candidatus Sigynarchaeum springense]